VLLDCPKSLLEAGRFVRPYILHNMLKKLFGTRKVNEGFDDILQQNSGLEIVLFSVLDLKFRHFRAHQ
jgi:hypothetical protein